MPSYRYTGQYQNGETVNGVVEAVSETAAIAQIRQSCEVVLSLTEVKTRSDPFDRFRHADAKALALVCRQFAIILKAGLPLVQTVDLVAGQTGDRLLKKLFTQVSEDISNGWSLSYSLRERGKRALPLTFIETIRAGEESGDLSSAFDRMSKYYDRMQKTRAKASSAMIYPAFVLGVAVIVVGIITLVAIPAFAATFASMGIELPLVTRFLIAASDFMNKYILVIILIAAGGLFCLRLYGHTEAGGYKLSRLHLRLPVFGKISLMTSASQFAHTMATMMAAGMPILQALEVAGRAVSNQCLSRAVIDIIPGVEAGRSVGQCMALKKELPQMLVQMTSVGEATGALESTLEVLADYYDNEVDTLTARALALLEPIIICFLAVIVVVILLAIYLPIFTLYGSI